MQEITKTLLGVFVLRLLRDIVKRHASELSSGAFVHVYSSHVVAWCSRRRSLHTKLVATFTNTLVAEEIETATGSTTNTPVAEEIKTATGSTTNTPVAEEIKTAAGSTTNIRPDVDVDFFVSLWSTELRHPVHLVEDDHFLSTHHHRHVVCYDTVRAPVPDLAGARPEAHWLVDQSSLCENQWRSHDSKVYVRHSWPAVSARCLQSFLPSPFLSPFVHFLLPAMQFWNSARVLEAL